LKSKHVIHAARPRLSDEEEDPIEQGGNEKDLMNSTEIVGWMLWDSDDLFDVKRIIEDRLPETQRLIVQAFLEGETFEDIECSHKFYRYHLTKAIEFIQKELGI
jgi:deoxyinosine 3'endonuclease (endonuclease V)